MKKIFIITNDTRDVDFSITRRVAERLRELGSSVALLPRARAALSDVDAGVIGECFDAAESDLMIVIGGDGSILDASYNAISNGIAVLGINAGRLGYLSGMDPSDLALLEDVVSDRCGKRELMTLSVSIKRGEEELPVARRAVNEAVISHGSLSRLSDIEVDCGGETGINYLADGVIISTPAGSTAYSLSAGGPIVESTLDSICITPICPHSFFARSIIISPDTVIRIKCNNDERTSLYLTVDGRENVELVKGRSN